MIKYFVSYTGHGRAGQIFGSSEVSLRMPVNGYPDVKVLTQAIESSGNLQNVVLLYWRRFEGGE